VHPGDGALVHNLVYSIIPITRGQLTCLTVVHPLLPDPAKGTEVSALSSWPELLLLSPLSYP